jgi:hypothetical protein
MGTPRPHPRTGIEVSMARYTPDGPMAPEVSADFHPGPNAALPHFDHDGNLCSDRTFGAAASAAPAVGVCLRPGRTGDAADRAHGSRLFGTDRRKGSTLRFTLQSTEFSMIDKGRKSRQLIEKIWWS